MEIRFYSRASLQHIRYLFSRPYNSHQTPRPFCSARNNDITRKHGNIHRKDVRCASTQANPIGGFYESLLEYPLRPASDPAAPRLHARPPPSENPNEKSSKAQKEEVAAKARVVFGSRLAGPAERRQVKEDASQLIAGIRVPPKPIEPDNCCMSGCVNCVWEVYRDDVEEWAAMKRKADRALAAQRRKRGTGMMLGEGEKNATHTMVSMDDDGGGSETNWGSDIGDDLDVNEFLKGVPVGIREFMKQEKRLKEKHTREGTSGG